MRRVYPAATTTSRVVHSQNPSEHEDSQREIRRCIQKRRSRNGAAFDRKRRTGVWDEPIESVASSSLRCKLTTLDEFERVAPGSTLAQTSGLAHWARGARRFRGGRKRINASKGHDPDSYFPCRHFHLVDLLSHDSVTMTVPARTNAVCGRRSPEARGRKYQSIGMKLSEHENARPQIAGEHSGFNSGIEFEGWLVQRLLNGLDSLD